MTMSEQEKQFYYAMLEICSTAEKECNYRPARFKQMIANEGGVATAKKLIGSPTPSDGFVQLWEHGRLDLTAEALVLNPQFQSLFCPEERDIALNRLRAYGYVVEYE